MPPSFKRHLFYPEEAGLASSNSLGTSKMGDYLGSENIRAEAAGFLMGGFICKVVKKISSVP